MKKWSKKEMVLLALWEVENLKFRFGMSGRGVRASEIMMLLPYSKPTVYKYLKELYFEGYVNSDRVIMNKGSQRTTANFWIDKLGLEHCEMRDKSS